ncbi:hypothetical protein [Dictyobacter vulcani]|uniref:hypothetical protein n=1 Tax=Dictyobacter vulcani TaxID=2607529 RepID=UPI00124F7ED1|nr:hypothetical protein [Dictyobacter vulcani]
MQNNNTQEKAQPISWQVAVVGGGTIGLGINFLSTFFTHYHNLWRLLLGCLLLGMGMSVILLHNRLQYQRFWKNIVWAVFIITLTIFIGYSWILYKYGVIF